LGRRAIVGPSGGLTIGWIARRVGGGGNWPG